MLRNQKKYLLLKSYIYGIKIPQYLFEMYRSRKRESYLLRSASEAEWSSVGVVAQFITKLSPSAPMSQSRIQMVQYPIHSGGDDQ